MRRRKRGVSRTVKMIPLSMALAALSTGAVFADGSADNVQVDMGNGKTYEFDLGLLADDAEYAAAVKAALGEAFEANRSILVRVGEDRWLEFSENASAELTLDDIKNASDDRYIGETDPNAEFILPSPY